MVKHFQAQAFSIKHALGTLRSTFEKEHDPGQLVHACLMYHSIVIVQSEDDIYELTVDKLRQQLLLLKGQKKLIITPFTNAGNLNQPQVSITFDDGHKDNYILVQPLMLELQIPWTVFVISDFVDNNSSYMTAKQLKELANDSLVTIGAHGKSHRPLTSMPFDEAKEELRVSKQSLEQVIQKPVEVMSFPHGAFNQKLIDAALELGYKKCATSVPKNNINASHAVVSRHCIYACETRLSFEQKINGKWDWMARR